MPNVPLTIYTPAGRQVLGTVDVDFKDGKINIETHLDPEHEIVKEFVKRDAYSFSIEKGELTEVAMKPRPAVAPTKRTNGPTSKGR